MTNELYLASLGMFLFLVLFGASALTLVLTLIPTRSKKYRKYLSNMYVASKIRALAKEDDLNLDAESSNFNAYVRKLATLATIDKDLDMTIEHDLKEKVEKTYEKGKK